MAPGELSSPGAFRPLRVKAAPYASDLRARPVRQTCARSSTTFMILVIASSTGMPFSCEPSR